MVAMSLLSATAACAQDDTSPSGRGLGLKAGFGTDPSQAVVGLQFSLRRERLRFFRVVPNVHVAFGDYTTTDVNVDFLARVVSKGWGVYGGIAPSLNMGSDAIVFGGTWIVGTQVPLIKSKATNLEARFGFSNAPQFRLLAVIVL